MKALCTAAAIIVTVCAVSAGAIADETTTTTTTTHERPGPSGPPGIVVGVPGVVGVEVGGAPRRDGCATRRTTTTNDNTGATRSTTDTRC